MINLTQLSDAELIAELKSAVDDEREAMANVLEHLREADRRRIYADYNCDSLWTFCLTILHYSEGAAQRRIAAMKLVREIPELKADLLSGKQNLSTLVQAQKFFRLENKIMKLTTDEKKEVLKSIENLSVVEGGKKLLAMSSFPVELARPEKERIIDEEHTELRIVVDSVLLAKLKRLKAHRSHANPEMKYADLLNYLSDLALKEIEKVPRRKSPPTSAVKPQSPPTSAVEPQSPPTSAVEPKSPPTSAVKPKPLPHRRAIPAALKREIRSAGTCGHRNPNTGQLCGSQNFLEIDHIVPVALGGTNSPENLQLRCPAHNQRRAFVQKILKVPVR